jgi:TolB-like protein/tetratricopeptide (TPR) repeat protein
MTSDSDRRFRFASQHAAGAGAGRLPSHPSQGILKVHPLGRFAMANHSDEASQDPPPSPGEGTTVPAPSEATSTPSRDWSWLWARVKRHKVVEWTLAYAAFAFAFLHATTLLTEALEWPHAVLRTVTLLLLIGLPIAPILAWYHGVRALKRLTGVELLLIALLLAIGGGLLGLYAHDDPVRTVAATTPSGTAAASPPAPASAVFAPPAHSIAVLPFTNLSGDPQQDYFSDGVSEELINALAHINALQVIARTSSFSFKGQNADISTIAHKLNVGAILEGSVRRSGNTVRITAQLINTVDGFHIWSQDYDRNLKNILTLQTEVATTVAQQMRISILGDEARKIEVGGTHVPQAYDAFLRGRQLSLTAENEEDLRRTLQALDEAIALDPNYAAAYALKARALDNLANLAADTHLYTLARQAAERSVVLAPDLAEAHVSLGWFVRVKQDVNFKAGLTEMERALALDEGSADVQVYYAAIQSVLGHPELAIAASQRAVQLDGENYRVRDGLVETLYLTRHFSDALLAEEDARALRSNGLHLAQREPLIRLALKQPELALPQCKSLAFHYCLALAFHQLGDTKAAELEFEKLKALHGDPWALDYAEVYAQWGDKKSALQWLLKAEHMRDPGLAFLKATWELDPIRNEPGFKALEERMDYPP